MKYNEFEIKWGGRQFIFVTRGRSKPFTAEEAIEYLQSRPLEFPDNPIVPVEDAVFEETTNEEAWQIPDSKSRRYMFHKDLQRGLPFCVEKYGQSEEAIRAEAKRLALGGF